jgi:hypothetical protein
MKQILEYKTKALTAVRSGSTVKPRAYCGGKAAPTVAGKPSEATPEACVSVVQQMLSVLEALPKDLPEEATEYLSAIRDGLLAVIEDLGAMIANKPEPTIIN